MKQYDFILFCHIKAGFIWMQIVYQKGYNLYEQTYMHIRINHEPTNSIKYVVQWHFIGINYGYAQSRKKKFAIHG